MCSIYVNKNLCITDCIYKLCYTKQMSLCLLHKTQDSSNKIKTNVIHFDPRNLEMTDHNRYFNHCVIRRTVCEDACPPDTLKRHVMNNAGTGMHYFACRKTFLEYTFSYQFYGLCWVLLKQAWRRNFRTQPFQSLKVKSLKKTFIWYNTVIKLFRTRW